MKELVSYLAKSLVDSPDEVNVSEAEEDDTVFLELYVAQSDLGKVIGKQGRTARAMRSLVSATASKFNKVSRLNIVE